MLRPYGSSSRPAPSWPSNSSLSPQHRPEIHPGPVFPGDGHGLSRLASFSYFTSSEHHRRHYISWWHDGISEIWTQNGTFRFTASTGGIQNECKSIDTPTAILPQFFLISVQSGVKSFSFDLGSGVRELASLDGHYLIECSNAVWTWMYTNGYVITQRGPLSAYLIPSPTGPPEAPGPSRPSLKISWLCFTSLEYGKSQILPGPRDYSSSLDHRTSYPDDPVNQFGIPQATMRCLELAEQVVEMQDLFTLSFESGLGPRDTLRRFVVDLKDGTATSMSTPISHPEPEEGSEWDEDQTSMTLDSPLSPTDSDLGHSDATLAGVDSPVRSPGDIMDLPVSSRPVRYIPIWEPVPGILDIRLDSHQASCRICFEPFLPPSWPNLGPTSVGIPLDQLGCEHIFHSVCIAQWLEVRSRCPTCHRTVRGVEPNWAKSPCR